MKGRLASDPRFDQMPPVFPDNLCDKCIKAGVSEIDHCWPVHWRGKDKKNV